MKDLKIVRSSMLVLVILLLSGCFSIELEIPSQVTTNTLFTMTAIPDGNEGAVTYEWRIDDQVVSEDASFYGMKTEVGSYNVSVTAKDEAGNEDSKTAVLNIVEQMPLSENFNLDVLVSDKGGYALEGATVTVNNNIAVSDAEGKASYVAIAQTELMIVSVAKEGYLTQTYQYAFDAPQAKAVVNMTLQSINDKVYTIDGSAAVSLHESELNTKLVLPENSFVDNQGNPVSGDVEIRITPIDIRSVGNSFLGGAQGLSNEGESVLLISAGMADYQFTQNGEELQLAEGIEATIEMDLAVEQGDDGRVYAAGDEIPMWWFDTQTGFWVEDGKGEVQVSETSPTGLKLVAKVSHFTTWNWDYYPDRDAVIFFSCLKDGEQLTASESCLVQFTSSTINRQHAIGSSGGEIIGAPANIVFNARGSVKNDAGEYAGSVTFRTQAGENRVVINLESSEEKTGFIQCREALDEVVTVIPCDIEMSIGANVSLTTEGKVNNTADFTYLSGSPLEINAVTKEGIAKSMFVDTAFVNGTLFVEVLFSNEIVSLSCTASLNGSQKEDIYCPALVKDDLGGEIELTDADFTGTPLKTSLSFDSDVQMVNFFLVSEFDQGHVRYVSHRDYYYISGDSTNITVDLLLDSKDVEQHYSVSASDLYEFECRGPTGAVVNCDIVWYTPMEVILYEGPISGLDDVKRKPSWLVGKLYIENAEAGFGNARMEGGEYFYSDFSISGNKITFRVE